MYRIGKALMLIFILVVHIFVDISFFHSHYSTFSFLPLFPFLTWESASSLFLHLVRDKTKVMVDHKIIINKFILFKKFVSFSLINSVFLIYRSGVPSVSWQAECLSFCFSFSLSFLLRCNTTQKESFLFTIFCTTVVSCTWSIYYIFNG